MFFHKAGHIIVSPSEYFPFYNCVLFHVTSLGSKNREALHKAINSICSGCNTKLFGGCMTDCEQVAAGDKEGTINSTLLLTDGLANVRVCDPPTLANHTRKLATRGVFTSTFGVGADFNHHLHESITNQGEGRFYFIENPNSIPQIFEN